ncbi:MAG: TIGR02710 family CRISPR-associated CARF protein [Acidobacteriota bacterium]
MNHSLLISVGGAASPVLFSIRHHRAERVIFFVSLNSRRLVSSQIMPALLEDPGHLPDHEFVVTPNEQSLGESVFALLQEVPSALHKLGAGESSWPELVDYTAGTKAMSSALVLASSKHPCVVSYIGAPDPSSRTKGGLGIVLDGRERLFLQENPWNKVAWLDARTAVNLFNRAQYGNGATLMKEVAGRVDEEPAHRLYAVLSQVFEGFHWWDVFDHKRALHHLRACREPLAYLTQTPQPLFPALKRFAQETREALQVLERIAPGQRSWEMVHDLLGNARRRALLEGKFEDATARCYAAIEKGAQHCLLYKYGVDPGHAHPEQIPEPLRQDFVASYQSSEVGDNGIRTPTLKFGLKRCLDLLVELEDPIGQRYSAREKRVRSHLEQRNRSILAHGLQPIEAKHFRSLFEDALELLGIRESELPAFPLLPL